MPHNPSFLHRLFPSLHRESSVENVAKRVEAAARSEGGGNMLEVTDPLEKISHYLDYLEECFDPQNPNKEEKVHALKESVYRQAVVTPKNIPESYRAFFRRQAVEQIAEDHIPEEQYRAQCEAVIADQKSSLDTWITYFTSGDAPYPVWLKVWAFKSIIQLESYDKKDRIFRKRDTTGTGEPADVKLFPDLDREALALVLDAVEKKYSAELQTVRGYRDELTKTKKKTGERLARQLARREAHTDTVDQNSGDTDFADIKLRINHLRAYEQEQMLMSLPPTEPATIEQFVKGLNSDNFAQLYATAVQECTPDSKELLSNIKGKWITYRQGTDPMLMVKSLQGHGTGWCTAGESIARAYIKQGDLHVYYSHDADGQPTIPRCTIRMNGNNIAEVRGIEGGGANQELDPFISPLVADKLTEFPDGKAYEKKSKDVAMLREIYNKSFHVDKKTGQKKFLATTLTRTELIFLYELDASIESFGYKRSPRIAELCQARKEAGLIESDMLTVFDCEPNQIARTKEQLAKNKEQDIETKAYVGPLYPNIFVDLADIEHIYTTFPEGRIRKRDIQIGGEDATTLEKKMRAQNINISDHVKFILGHKDFTVSKDKKVVGTVHLRVRDLGFSNGATASDIYAKAEELGLDLCPAEVGPHYCLQYRDQPMNEYLSIPMKQIVDPDGVLHVFYMHRLGDVAWLLYRWSKPDFHWDADLEVVFSLRK